MYSTYRDNGLQNNLTENWSLSVCSHREEVVHMRSDYVITRHTHSFCRQDQLTDSLLHMQWLHLGVVSASRLLLETSPHSYLDVACSLELNVFCHENWGLAIFPHSVFLTRCGVPACLLVRVTPVWGEGLCMLRNSSFLS